MLIIIEIGPSKNLGKSLQELRNVVARTFDCCCKNFAMLLQGLLNVVART